MVRQGKHRGNKGNLKMQVEWGPCKYTTISYHQRIYPPVILNIANNYFCVFGMKVQDQDVLTSVRKAACRSRSLSSSRYVATRFTAIL